MGPYSSRCFFAYPIPLLSGVLAAINSAWGAIEEVEAVSSAHAAEACDANMELLGGHCMPLTRLYETLTIQLALSCLGVL